MNATNEPSRSTLLALLPPLGAAIGSIFAFGVLIIATRRGQFASIASFGAGSAVAALASVAVGGGTTLAYTTGTLMRQRAVRIVRRAMVLPAVCIATAAATLFYSALGSLNPLGVVAGGLATVASVGAELDASYLRRQLETRRLFIADILSRAIAFGVIFLGSQFAFAMLTGAFARAVLLWAYTGSDPSRKGSTRISKPSLALAYGAGMTSLSILYSICDRVGALVAPAAGPIPVAGGFLGVLNAQQNASGVLMAGLQTTLAARAQQRARLAWANRLDLVLIATGLAAAGAMIVWREPLLGLLGLGATSQPGRYWVAIALLIPASLASRVLEFRFLTTGGSRKAFIPRAVATVIAVASAVAAIAGSQISILATGLLFAELASIATSVSLLTLIPGPKEERDHA